MLSIQAESEFDLHLSCYSVQELSRLHNARPHWLELSALFRFCPLLFVAVFKIPFLMDGLLFIYFWLYWVFVAAWAFL